MSRIKSVEEILNITESCHTPDKLARKYIVKAVDKLIRTKAREQEYSVLFEVPAMIVFQPRYDRDVVTRAIAKHYRGIGFSCDVTDYSVSIAWGLPSDDDDDGACAEEVSIDEREDKEEGGGSSGEDEPVAMKFSVGGKASLAERLADMKKPN